MMPADTPVNITSLPSIEDLPVLTSNTLKLLDTNYGADVPQVMPADTPVNITSLRSIEDLPVLSSNTLKLLDTNSGADVLQVMPADTPVNPLDDSDTESTSFTQYMARDFAYEQRHHPLLDAPLQPHVDAPMMPTPPQPTYRMMRVLAKEDDANRMFNTLEKDIVYEEDYRAQSRGEFFALPHQKTLYGEKGLHLTLSSTLKTRPWLPELLELKRATELDFLSEGESFNAVLITRFGNGADYQGSHKNDEREMDPTAPVVTLSLGALRNLALDQPCAERVNIPLPSGYAVRVSDITWTFSVPKEPTLSDPTIHLTFMRLQVPELPLIAIPEGYHDLGGDVLFGASLFQNSVRVHVRQFTQVNGKLVPTRKGIVMSPYHFQKFCDSLESFRYKQSSQSLSVGNTLLLTTSPGSVLFQYMFKDANDIYKLSSAHMRITTEQFELLAGFSDQVSLAVRKLTFDDLFTNHIVALAPAETEDTDTEEDVSLVLCRLFSDKLKPLVDKEELYCQGCETVCENQLAHDCLHVVDKVFDSIIFKVDLYELAANLVQAAPNADFTSFLGNYDPDSFLSKCSSELCRTFGSWYF